MPDLGKILLPEYKSSNLEACHVSLSICSNISVIYLKSIWSLLPINMGDFLQKSPIEKPAKLSEDNYLSFLGFPSQQKW